MADTMVKHLEMFLGVLFLSTVAGLYYGGLCPPDSCWFLRPHWLPHALYWTIDYCPNDIPDWFGPLRLSWG